VCVRACCVSDWRPAPRVLLTRRHDHDMTDLPEYFPKKFSVKQMMKLPMGGAMQGKRVFTVIRMNVINSTLQPKTEDDRMTIIVISNVER
jgi:hypothetical protein